MNLRSIQPQRQRLRSVTLRTVALLSVCPGWATATPIAENGQSRAVVIVADDASAPEKQAASDLAGFLQLVTDAEFDVVGRYDGDRTRLLVGPGAARLADPDFSAEELGQEGIVLRTAGSDLLIVGGRPRGTLYAVYTFLEDVVGCRWWAPGVAHIPRRPTLDIGSLNVTYVPPFEYRAPLWGQAQGEWLVRNKCNGARVGPDPARGGWVATLGLSHAFDYYIPPDEYFDEHPEWFSEIDGVRIRDRTQLCMTNEQMTEEFIRNMLAHVRARYEQGGYKPENPDPGISSVWISQNDWGNYCQCAPCTEVNEREESLAGTNIHFANKVGDALAAEFPALAARTLAYNWTQKPPEHVRVSPNVIVQLATTDCSYSHSYTHEQNGQFRDRLVEWASRSDRIYIWDYLVNFAHYLLPYPNLRTLGPNAQLFADSSVKGIMAQGAWESDGHGGVALGGEMAELRAWVLAKLFWNPYLDAEVLIDEFLDGYYGAAGRHVRAYLDVIHDSIEKTGQTLGMLDAPTTEFLSLAVLSEAYRILQQAEAAAAADGDDVILRVQVAQMGLLYAFLVRWDELWYTARETGAAWPLEEKLDDTYARFISIKNKGNVTRLSEQDARDVFDSVEQRLGRDPPPPPPGCENLPRNRWADLIDSGFRIEEDSARKPVIVDDDKAVDGKAALVPSSPDDRMTFTLGGRVPLIAAAKQRRLQVRVSVKIDATDEAGVAFECGIFHVTANENIVSKTVMASEIDTGSYETIDLGTHTLAGWRYLWIRPVGDVENVRSILVDRIWLILEEE